MPHYVTLRHDSRCFLICRYLVSVLFIVRRTDSFAEEVLPKYKPLDMELITAMDTASGNFPAATKPNKVVDLTEDGNGKYQSS